MWHCSFPKKIYHERQKERRMNEQSVEIRALVESIPEIRPLFAHIPRRFMAQMELRHLPRRAKVIRRGEESSHIFIICTGSIKVLNEFENGKTFAIAFREAPGFAGLMEFLAEKTHHTATINTASETDLIRISKRVLSQWIEEDHEAYKLFVRAFANQMHYSLRTMGSAYVYPKYYVLAQYLVHKYEHLAAGNSLAVVTETREELAQILGFSLRSLYRLTQQLQNEGYCRIIKKKLHLSGTDLERMKNEILEEY